MLNASVRNPDVHSSSLPRRTSSPAQLPAPPSPALPPGPGSPGAARGGLVAPYVTFHIPGGNELFVLIQGRTKFGCPALDFPV